MKIVFYFNATLYLITLIVPIYNKEFTSGLFIQFWLGIIHLILGAFYLVISSSVKKSTSKKTKLYWFMVIGYFVSLITIGNLGFEGGLMQNIFLVIIPMSIGLYNVYVNYLIQK